MATKNDELTDYFRRLAVFSHDFLDRLPIARRPQSIHEVMARLQPALDEAMAASVEELRALNRPSPPLSEPAGAGMNTVGLLADRLTILCIKAWNVRHKQNAPEEASVLFQRHVGQVVDSMACCVPGEKDLLKKVTHLTSKLVPVDWEDSYYGLLASNVLLWEAQEILYLKDLDTVECDELRHYIKWFSYGNIDRNTCISACEEHYWKKAV
jgi:hypothetical protein